MTRDQKDITLCGMADAEWKLQNLFLILLYLYFICYNTKQATNTSHCCRTQFNERGLDLVPASHQRNTQNVWLPKDIQQIGLHKVQISHKT